MIRRHLHFSWDEWEALPWWQQQSYLEGLQEEFGDGSYVDEPFESDDLAGAAKLGVNVQRV